MEADLESHQFRTLRRRVTDRWVEIQSTLDRLYDGALNGEPAMRELAQVEALRVARQELVDELSAAEDRYIERAWSRKQ